MKKYNFKIKKFESYENNSDFVEYIEDKLDLVDSCDEYIGSYYNTNKNSIEIGFLFGAIGYKDSLFIEKIKNIIEYYDTIDIKPFNQGGDRLGVEIIFYSKNSNIKKLEDKIRLIFNSGKYNI